MANHGKFNPNRCERCRRTKKKCSGGQPSCASCTRTGHNCVYPAGRDTPVASSPPPGTPILSSPPDISTTNVIFGRGITEEGRLEADDDTVMGDDMMVVQAIPGLAQTFRPRTHGGRFISTRSQQSNPIPTSVSIANPTITEVTEDEQRSRGRPPKGRPPTQSRRQTHGANCTTTTPTQARTGDSSRYVAYDENITKRQIAAQAAFQLAAADKAAFTSLPETQSIIFSDLPNLPQSMQCEWRTMALKVQQAISFYDDGIDVDASGRKRQELWVLIQEVGDMQMKRREESELVLALGKLVDALKMFYGFYEVLGACMNTTLHLVEVTGQPMIVNEHSGMSEA